MRASDQYREEQRAAQEVARGKDAAYYREYRRRHPEQRERNRSQQAERDRRRRATADALPGPVEAGPVEPGAETGAPPAGRYRMQLLDVAGGASFEVLLTPAEAARGVLATMDSLSAREAALEAASRG
jgi:hypothetical protein